MIGQEDWPKVGQVPTLASQTLSVDWQLSLALITAWYGNNHGSCHGVAACTTRT